MKKLLLSLSIIGLLSFSAHSQQLSFYHSSGWNFGFNIGSVYERSDIKRDGDLGFCLTFGYDYLRRNTPMRLGLRLQYLRGFADGYDYQLTPVEYGPDQFTAHYPNGYYRNYWTDLHDITLEQMIYAESLRRKGILLYGFIGYGYTAWKVKADQFDELGDSYDYSVTSIDPTQDKYLIVDSLKILRDMSFETTVVPRQGRFMPSFGLGIGLISKGGFAFSIEHKATFPGVDDFDGSNISLHKPKLNDKNDIYHYTTLIFSWNIGEKRNTKNDHQDDQTDNNPNQGYPPMIRFTNPAVNPVKWETSFVTVIAEVTNVEDRDQITVTVNGNNYTGYDYKREEVELTSSLHRGENTITVKATNSYGSDQETQIIYYLQEIPDDHPIIDPIVEQRPAVTITTPTANLYNTNTQQQIVKATILNVEAVNGVKFEYNGKDITNFSFNPATDQFEAAVSLLTGNNSVEITGTNTAGWASDESTINYSTQNLITEEPPVVTITLPTKNPISVSETSTTIKATVTNVESADEIVFTQNSLKKGTFTYNAKTDELIYTATLIEGANTFSITATNTAGSDSKSTVINYSEVIVAPAPEIIVTSPSRSPYSTTEETYAIKATVKNVDSKSNISFTQGNSSISNFTYSTTTDEFSYTATLIKGDNNFVITASNTSGSDQESLTIKYTPATVVSPPVVTITQPSKMFYTTETSSYTIEATVTNIESSKNITFTQNNSGKSGFSFTASNDEFSYSASLVEGSNTFTITATNEGGTDTKTVTISYTEPVVVRDPPQITLVLPAKNPYETQNSSETIKATIVNVDSKNDVNFTVGGIKNTGFSFDTKTNTFSYTATLVKGSNSYIISAVNESDSDSKSFGINYTVPITLVPVITITQPTKNPYSTNLDTGVFKAKVENVLGSNDITLKINGMKTTNFTYDPSTKLVVASIALNMGDNTIEIKGTSAGGTATKTQTITRIP